MRHPILRLSAALTLSAAAQGCQILGEPTDFFQEFPAATTTKFYNGADALAAVNAGECIVLTAQRYYVAPQGLLESGDIENAAKGVDAAVKIDGGNGYRIVGYGWTPAYPGTVLTVTFDTLLCKPATAPGTNPAEAPPTQSSKATTS